MEIYLVRHTRVDVAPGICYGQSDINCGTTFADEARQVQQKLGDLNAHSVLSSPSKRCLQLAEKLTTDFKTDPRLMELHFGDWEMQAWNDLEGPVLQQWMQDFVKVACPNGESYVDLSRRCEDFLREIAETHQHKKVVLITHGGVIRAMVSQVLGLSLENSFRLDVDYGSVSLISQTNGVGKVKFLNQ